MYVVCIVLTSNWNTHRRATTSVNRRPHRLSRLLTSSRRSSHLYLLGSYGKPALEERLQRSVVHRHPGGAPRRLIAGRIDQIRASFMLEEVHIGVVFSLAGFRFENRIQPGGGRVATSMAAMRS